MKMLKRVWLAIAGICTVVISTTASGAISFQLLGFLNSPFPASEATGISADGSTVVGWSNAEYNGTNFPVRPFVWTKATGMVELAGPTAQSGEAYGVSADGSVIVGWQSQADGNKDPVKWTRDGSATYIPFLRQNLNGLSDGPYWGSYAVSGNGFVVVGTSPADGSNPGEYLEATRWSAPSGTLPLGTPPPRTSSGYSRIAYGASYDGSVIVGTGADEATGGHSAPFMWTQTTGMVRLTSSSNFGTEGTAYGVSADGSVVVGTSISGSTTAFKLTTSSGMIPLTAAPFTSHALAVSADGKTTVGYVTGGSFTSQTPVLWDDNNKMIDLRNLLATNGIDTSEFNSEFQATCVSADGHIVVGFGQSSSGLLEGWELIVPEPSAAFIMFCAMSTFLQRLRASTPIERVAMGVAEGK